jgi:hypothetical protein
MLQIAHLSNSYWAEAIQTACYLQNCFYTSALTQATPFELWTSLKPDLSHLRIFGCPAFSQIPDEKCSKLETKALQCVFVDNGEAHGVKATAYIIQKLDAFSLPETSSFLKISFYQSQVLKYLSRPLHHHNQLLMTFISSLTSLAFQP